MIISYGDSCFDEGEIICFEDNCEDMTVSNKVGDFIFQFNGNSALENDRISYTFDFYPKNNNIGTVDLTTMKITLPTGLIVTHQVQKRLF